MNKRTAWTVAFLGITATAIGLEIAAAADGNPDTATWTQLVVEHVPAPFTAVVIAALVIWVPAHFWSAYRSKRDGLDG